MAPNKGGLAIWEEGNTVYISVVFSWLMESACVWARFYKAQGYTVHAGGPAAMMNPSPLERIADSVNKGNVNALLHHNPNATFTSRGCVRKCLFCVVPRIEGNLVELTDWEPKPLVFDNNLLACSRKHFDSVIDKLKPIKGVDFNQGLDARLLTSYHADRLAELDMSVVRLAWDDIKTENQVLRAHKMLLDAGFTKRYFIRVYLLVGFNDTPEDAYYRARTVMDLKMLPFPMRYQPPLTPKKNSYVGPGWTNKLLADYTRYWCKQIWLHNIPFEEYGRINKIDNTHQPLLEGLS